MTSSGLLTNAYEGLREKTIFPFGQRKRQLSMDLGQDEEGTGSTVLPQGEETSIDSQSDHVTSDHVTSDHVSPDPDHVPSSDGTIVQGNGIESAPNLSTPIPTAIDTSSINTTPVTTAKLESSPNSQPVSAAVPQTPTIPGYVPRKRGRPKGSTTKNRRVKVAPGGLNLWAPPKNINTSKLSTLEMMALAAQNSQQSQSQLMASLLLQQQQHKQPGNHSTDALQLALACDPSLQKMLQQSPVPQQRLFNSMPSGDSRANSLLELQLRQEIEKLEKILLNHDQRASSSVIDTALVNQLITQSNPPKQDNVLSELVPNSMMTNGTFTGTPPPSTIIQNLTQSSNFAPPDLSAKGSTRHTVMERGVRDTILREAMMKLEQPQTSTPIMTPPSLSHSTLGLSSSENNSQWSHENFLKTCLPSAAPRSAAPSSAAPNSAAPSRKEDDEVTKQFMDVIKTLSSGNKETAQLLQLLLDQTRTPSSQVMKMSQSSSTLSSEASTPQSDSTIMKQSQCTKSMQVPPAATDQVDSARIADLEQLISSLKSPAQGGGSSTPVAGAPWPHNFGLPKPRAPVTANGTLKSTERRKHRGRPRKYPEQFYNVVNGKMKYPGAKERGLENNISSNDKCTVKTESTDTPASTPAHTTPHTSTPHPTTPQSSCTPPAPHTVPARKRGRPKGSKNKPLLITSPQQLLDLRFPYPSNAGVWSGMPGVQQSQIAAVLSGLNHKLNRQWTSFTV